MRIFLLVSYCFSYNKIKNYQEWYISLFLLLFHLITSSTFMNRHIVFVVSLMQNILPVHVTYHHASKYKHGRLFWLRLNQNYFIHHELNTKYIQRPKYLRKET